MKLLLRNVKGEETGIVEVSDAVFGQQMNNALVHQALVMYQLNQRQGTQNTRTRAEVSGGGRKPWSQKHTGRARQGSTRAPQWRTGGKAFGPKPRDWRRDMPRRMRHQALRCVLSDKAQNGKLVLVDELDSLPPRTKEMVQLLKGLGIGSSALIVTREPQENVIRSTGNIQKVWTLPVRLLNAHELLKRDTIVMTLDAARGAEDMWHAERPHRKAFVASEEAVEVEEVPVEPPAPEVESREAEAEAVSQPRPRRRQGATQP